MVHYQVTLTAAAQNLGTALGLTAATDLPFRFVSFQTTTADAYLGGPTVSTTDYGLKVTAAGATQEAGHYDTGPLKLGQMWAVGDGAVLHILAIPY